MPLLHLYEAWLHNRYWMESRADEIHRVRCADGVRIAVKRFLPPAGAPTRNLPILCVPGLGADSHNFDAPAPSGLGPYLAEMGFDTFAVDLRGTGLSEVDPKIWSDITFDDHLALDFEAAVNHVCDVTGAPEVMTMGHSMGGMLIYAALATLPAPRVRAAVTIVSPVGFPQKWEVAPALRPLYWLGEHVPGLHAGRFMRWLVPLALRPRDFASKRFLVRENVDENYIRPLMLRAVQDIPRGLLLQFRDWVMHDAFRSLDRSVDYRARLDGVKTPVLVVAAPEDRLARVDAVARALPLLDRAEYVLASKSEGFRADYGHIDVVFGREAHDELFPRFLEFFARHDGSALLSEGATYGTAGLH